MWSLVSGGIYPSPSEQEVLNKHGRIWMYQSSLWFCASFSGLGQCERASQSCVAQQPWRARGKQGCGGDDTTKAPVVRPLALTARPLCVSIAKTIAASTASFTEEPHHQIAHACIAKHTLHSQTHRSLPATLPWVIKHALLPVLVGRGLWGGGAGC